MSVLPLLLLIGALGLLGPVLAGVYLAVRLNRRRPAGGPASPPDGGTLRR